VVMGLGKGKVKELKIVQMQMVWMMPHNIFCTIGKCDLISCFLSIESILASCKYHPLFLFSF
jgi:hypothetical protein